MSAQELSNTSGPQTLTDAAARFGISPQTLRRLCGSGQLKCTEDSRGWRVEPKEVENYLLARRPAGRQSVALWLQGPAPNTRLRDGVGWLFKAAGRGGAQIPVQIWFSSELVQVLQQDDFDVRDVVVRAAEGLVSDALLESDELTPGQEILYGSADRSFVLRAAGLGDESYFSSDAPMEEGASIVYEFTARDYAQDGVWPGDSIDLGEDAPFVDVVVDIRPEGSARRVRTVRVTKGSTVSSRVKVIQDALRTYEARCRRLGLVLGLWTMQVASRANALTLSQQRVLELACETWHHAGDWPAFSYVEARTDREYDMELRDVLRTLPPGLLWGYSSYGQETDKLALSVAGLSLCESGTADIALFVAIVKYLVQRRRDFLPASPTQAENLTVTSDEVRRDVEVAEASPIGAVERLYELLVQDSTLTHGGGRQVDGKWNLIVGPESRRYRGVEQIEDYLARRQPDVKLVELPTSAPRLAPLTSLSQVVEALDAGGTSPINLSPGGASGESDVFVLMPFEQEFDGVWMAIQEASRELELSCIRADSITVPGRITDQIVEGIRSAATIVVDVTGNNANVMFELGYADALGKPIVVLNQRVSEAPFDLKDWRQIAYQPAALPALQSTLKQFLHQVLVKPREGMGVSRTGQTAPPADRPILDIRGAEVPGSESQVGQLTVKNVGGQPALACRAVIRGAQAWFLGGPTTIAAGEDKKLSAVGISDAFPDGLIGEDDTQAVIYGGPDGWLYLTTHRGQTASWHVGMTEPGWVSVLEALPGSA